MKLLLVLFIATFLFAGCSWFGEPEQYKTESGRTTYRSADQSAPGTVAATPQKVPGESRR